MSWIDKIQSDLIIKTGDGKEYRPNYLNATKQVDYNLTEFTFVNLAGSLGDKREPLGRRFALEIYFQGDDHLDTAQAFEKSANDRRPWTVTHPYYGILKVHPFGLHFDNSQHNISKITGMLLETITRSKPKTTVDPVDNIQLIKENTDALFSVSSSSVPPITQDINTISTTANRFYSFGQKVTSLASESEAYFDAFNKANAALSLATTLPLEAMLALQTFLSAPANFKVSVKTRMDLLSQQFDALKTFSPDKNSNVSTKKIFELQGATLIASMALSAATPQPGDFTNMAAVLVIIDSLYAAYTQFFGVVISSGNYLDNLCTATNGDPKSYSPDYDSMNALNKLVNYTLANLFTIALSARQERSIVLEADSNWIVLTHRFYGLDPLDNNITELMSNNNVGLNEILLVKKGRTIVYYI